VAATKWREWTRQRRRFLAPELLGYEVTNVLHRYVLSGELTEAEADEALDILLDFDISLLVDPEFHILAIRLAREHSLAATYDAHYLAVARSFGAELWTADRRLANAVGPTLKWVHCITSK